MVQLRGFSLPFNYISAGYHSGQDTCRGHTGLILQKELAVLLSFLLFLLWLSDFFPNVHCSAFNVRLLMQILRRHKSWYVLSVCIFPLQMHMMESVLGLPGNAGNVEQSAFHEILFMETSEFLCHPLGLLYFPPGFQ